MFDINNINKGKLIGKGRFSKVYEDTNNKDKVIIISNCYQKECLSFGWIRHKHYYPVVKLLGTNMYYMERYNKVRSLKKNLKPSEYEIYKELRAFQDKLIGTGYDAMYKQLDSMELSNTAYNILEAGIVGMSNYGRNIGIDVYPRNVTAHKGKLVLLDIWFIIDQL